MWRLLSTTFKRFTAKRLEVRECEHCLEARFAVRQYERSFQQAMPDWQRRILYQVMHDKKGLGH